MWLPAVAWVHVYRPDRGGPREEPERLNGSSPAFEAFRNDLIAYLADKLDIPREVVLARLGDSLLDPLAEAGRQHYARANYLRRRT